MRGYYERRAPEYDDWWLGTGLFAQRDRPGWSEEVAVLLDVVAALPAASVLDVACGTGFLSAHLAGEVVGLDQSAAMLRIAAERVPNGRVVCAEAVPLPFRDGEFDRVFTSHFYGHLLPGEPPRSSPRPDVWRESSSSWMQRFATMSRLRNCRNAC